MFWGRGVTAAQHSSQVLVFEGKSCSHFRAFTRYVSDWNGLPFLYAACESTPCHSCCRHALHAADTGHGRWDHGSCLECPRTVVVSCAATSVDSTEATWASLTCTQTPHGAVVRRPRLAVELASLPTLSKSLKMPAGNGQERPGKICAGHDWSQGFPRHQPQRSILWRHIRTMKDLIVSFMTGNCLFYDRIFPWSRLCIFI